MSNENFHHLPWPSRADRHIERVTGIGRGVREPGEEAEVFTPTPRVVRRRTMSAAQARAIVAEWTTGATPCPVPAGWSAWERVRADASGLARVQRLAVDENDPTTVINWSVPGRPRVDDETAWRAALNRSTAIDRSPGESNGWAA